MMRGLQGNTYAKILINDIPVKPYATRGMPIGAQLPIREAERIQVIFGPAAAVYGADASAGVINIVTKNSDRPLYTQAEIGLGSDGFSSLHVMFGGKLGRGKRILRYSIFGSNTSFNSRRIFRSDSLLFNPNLYDPTQNYADNLNYSDKLNATPHLSRMVGAKFDYKNLHFSSIVMVRRDHSALGQNPTAISYENPNNYIQDRIINTHFSWTPSWEKWGMKLNVDVLFYQREATSSSKYVDNNLKRLFDHTIERTYLGMPAKIDSSKSIIYNNYFSGDRFAKSESFEPTLEYLAFFTPIKEIELLLGMQAGLAISDIEDYRKFTRSNAIEFNAFASYSYLNFSTFAQAYIDLNKVKGIASVNFSNSDVYESQVNPRIALLFPLSPSLSIRGFYGTAFRVPSAFYYANTFTVSKDNLLFYETGGSLGTFLDGQNTTGLSPEKNTTVEFGLRWNQWKKLSVDANFYYSKTNNAITFVEKIPLRDNPMNPESNIYAFSTGYTNFGDSYLEVLGSQANIVFKTRTLHSFFEAKLGLNVTTGEKQLPGNNTIILGSVPEQPKFSAQLQLAIPIGKKWALYMDHLYQGESVSEIATLSLREVGQFDRETLLIPEYYTLDLRGSYQISKAFSAYLQILNVFNENYGGLSATGTTDDLFYNAQSARLFRFGLNYRLN
ncbi:MAG: outer membrane receptor protein involved in Fe transport [Saprospiraceae bacterium]|jgi:outer membrane receptor protein involved in Fe transport